MQGAATKLSQKQNQSLKTLKEGINYTANTKVDTAGQTFRTFI